MMEQVLAAQKAWGDGIVAISSAHTNGQDFELVATDHIQTLYGYGMTPVLFKPKLAAEQQFRSDFEGALSYFVATNNAAEEDKGFAVKGKTAVRFKNDGTILSGKTAIAMGNYFFTGPIGTETKVEYSFFSWMRTPTCASTSTSLPCPTSLLLSERARGANKEPFRPARPGQGSVQSHFPGPGPFSVLCAVRRAPGWSQGGD